MYTPWSEGLKRRMTSSPLTSLSVFEVLLFEITTPSLLHSRLGTGEPRAAHCRITFSKMFLTLRMEDGAVVITGGALRVKKGEKQNRWFILCQRQRYFDISLPHDQGLTLNDYRLVRQGVIR